MKINKSKNNLVVPLFILCFLPVMGRDFFALAQEAIPAANKSEILKYREQRNIFSDDLQDLGYIESAQVLNDETSSVKKLLYYCKQGRDYFNSRQYDKALVEFKNALDWDPQYKPALRYVEIIQEKLLRSQRLKEKQDLAERKTKQAAQKRQEKEDARFNRKERIKYEQDVKKAQQRYSNLKKNNEARIKALLDARAEQYECDKIIQKEFAQEQERIKAENAKLENFARIKAEKELAEKFFQAKLAKEKNIARRNFEEKKKIEQQKKEKDLAARMAKEEILLSERERAKHEQVVKLEQEKSKNLKGLNEARFRDALKEKLKQNNLIKHSSVELAQAAAADSLSKPGEIIGAASLPDGSGAKYKEYMTDIFVPDNLELAKIQQGFENKYIEAFREKERIKKDYIKLLEQVNSLIAENNRVKGLESSLEKNKLELQLFKRENENVKKDYNSLLSQVKELLVYRERLKNLNSLLEKVMLDKNLFEKERDAVKLENVEFKRKNENLQAAFDKITKDADRYKGAYEKLYSEAVVKELKIKAFAKDSPVLEKKITDMESELKQLRGENELIKKDYAAALTKLNESMLELRKAKGLEDILVKSKADLNSLTKEKNALKAERNRIVSQMKGLLGDRRRVKKLESLLQESSVDIKAMQKENDIMRKEYNNLLVQVKASIVDKKHLKGALEALEKNKTDMNLLVKGSAAVKAQNAELKDKIKKFEEEQIKVIKERQAYKISDNAARQLKDGMSDLEKEKSGLSAQLKQAQRENDAVKKNYEGLLAQVNDLLADKDKLKELSDIIEKNKTDKSLLEKDNAAVKRENLGLENRVKELESLQAQLAKARDEYKTAYEKERNDSAKNELKEGIVKLEKEKNDISFELKQAKNDNENVKKENLELRNKIEEFEFQLKAARKQETSETLMKELKQMQKENELIKKDYASLLAQMKDLLVDSRRVKDMQTLLEKNKANIALLEKEKAAAKAENAALKNKAQRLEELEKKLVKDKQAVGYGGEFSDRKLKIKELKAEDKNVQESESIFSKANDAQVKELQSKLEAEKKQLSRQADEYKKKYLSELEKNNLALQGANNLPQKFEDAVKKNAALQRESAGMHYNLGVFFIKNKEYDRAIIEFEKSIELYPEDPYSYYNLGYIYAQYLVDRGKAVKYFRQFLQFVKNDDKDVEWVKDYLLTWEVYK